MDEVLLSLSHCSTTNAKLQNDQFLLAVDLTLHFKLPMEKAAG